MCRSMILLSWMLGGRHIMQLERYGDIRCCNSSRFYSAYVNITDYDKMI